MGPFTNDDAGTVSTRVRHTIFLPAPYVGIFLNRNLSPKEAWLQLWSRIVADNKAIKCASLITWLQTALTQTVDQGPSQVQVPMNPGTLDTSHVHHRALLHQR